jgi:hypothetical protein
MVEVIINTSGFRRVRISPEGDVATQRLRCGLGWESDIDAFTQHELLTVLNQAAEVCRRCEESR